MQDPISDMLTQIRNAQTVGKSEVVLQYSKFKHQLGDILQRQGLIEEVVVVAKPREKRLGLKLKYQGGNPVIAGIKQVSRPGQRIYSKAGNLPRTQTGFGVTIVSTSKGLLTDQQARKQHLGGEVICQIW